MGIVVADQIPHQHQKLLNRRGVFLRGVLMGLVPVGVGMGQTAVGVGHAEVGMGKRVPLHTADLIHPLVGDHDLHSKVGSKQLHQLLGAHQAIGNLAGGAAVMIVDGLPAGAMGNGQPPVLLQKSRKSLNQMLGIGKMGEGVIYHDSVKLPVKGSFLHVAANHLHFRFRPKLSGCNFCHFGGNVNAGDRCRTPLQIVGKQHPGAAGYVQNVTALSDFRVVQNFSDDFIIFDHFRVPCGSAAVKIVDNILFLHSVFLLVFCLEYHITYKIARFQKRSLPKKAAFRSGCFSQRRRQCQSSDSHQSWRGRRRWHPPAPGPGTLWSPRWSWRSGRCPRTAPGTPSWQ